LQKAHFDASKSTIDNFVLRAKRPASYLLSSFSAYLLNCLVFSKYFFRKGSAMIKPIVFCTLVVSSVALGACAPPGQGALGFRDIDWPRADHLMSANEGREIEVLLVRLGYMRSGADGQITTSTRKAIRTYQRDIGAPITGYVSTPLLHSLRVNAPQQASSTATYVQPVASKAPATKTRVSKPAPRRPVATQARKPVVKASPAGGGDGGAGGSGGSGWN
jgi:hypothetical protein